LASLAGLRASLSDQRLPLYAVRGKPHMSAACQHRGTRLSAWRSCRFGGANPWPAWPGLSSIQRAHLARASPRVISNAAGPEASPNF